MSTEASKYIGQRLRRREDQYLLRGEGRYLDDIPEPAGTLHMAFVLSPHASAKILSIDAAEARALPGVYAVLTGDDIAQLVKPIHVHNELKGYHNVDRDAVARQAVRFVGEQVAVVLAESKYVAHDAVELVRVEYEVLAAAVDLEEAIRPGAPQVHDGLKNNLWFEGQFATPGFAEQHGKGEHRIVERFKHGRISAVPMEPRGCFAVPDQGDSIVFYTSTQIPHLARTGIAGHIGRPESCIRVVVPEVGGGFGMKAQVFPEEFIASALCFKLRRPIKWVQDRREELLNNTHARHQIYDVEVDFDSQGVVTSMKLELHADAGAYSAYPWAATMECTGGARMVVGPYRIRNYSYRTRAVATNTALSGVYRGVSIPACTMVMEGIMDRIARKLALDPAEVRLRNTIGEFPYVNAVGVRYDIGSYQQCLKLVTEKSGYAKFRKQLPPDRLVDGKYRGVGIGHMVEPSGGGAMAWRARGLTQIPGIDSSTIRVEPTGQITVYVSHAGAGQGHLTTFAQVAAEHLGARIEDIRIVQGDTATSPYGTNTFASRSAITGGGAVIRAAQKVSAKLRRLAGSVLEASAEDIVLEDGKAAIVGVPGRHVEFRALAQMAYSMGSVPLPKGEEFGLEASEYYDPPMLSNANATHIVFVSVDAHDGRVSIDKYYIAHDAGRIINPMIVDGQTHGGVVQGIGEALMEEMVYDENGQLLTASLLDYLLPTALDVPADISILHVETPSIDSLGGFKGVGEGGVIGCVPALLSAVGDALSGIGANVNTLPMRPSYLRSLIRNATQGKPARPSTQGAST